jgi:DivIVA domain-containing protein
MGQFLLLVVVALTVGAVVFGVTVLLTGGDRGLSPAEPDGRAVPLPVTRPLVESDIAQVRFDTVARGYRMAQVDQAMRRAAYDIGYKDELINVLEAEVNALRAGRYSDAEVLRRAREAAQATTVAETPTDPDAPASDGDGEVTIIELGEAAPAIGGHDWAAATTSAAATWAVAAASAADAVPDQPGATVRQPAPDRADQPAADRDLTATVADHDVTATDGGDGTGSSTSGAGDEGTTDPENPVESDDQGIDEGDDSAVEDEPLADGMADDDPGDGSDFPESDSVVQSRR